MASAFKQRANTRVHERPRTRPLTITLTSEKLHAEHDTNAPIVAGEEVSGGVFRCL